MQKSQNFESIRLSDYEYILPEDKIAKFPLEKRDASKLLQYKDGNLEHFHFYDLPALIPSDSMMVFNNTKVIPARLIFQRVSGARIEIFLLKPILPSPVINEVMLNSQSVTWECMIGNSKKWKDGEILEGSFSSLGKEEVVRAELVNREDKTVRFTWSGINIPFVNIVEAAGEVPLPPYLNRKPVAEDKPRYQTVYSQKEGAVAAPTAGLHFTEEVLDALKAKGIKEEFLTLHVSAGTFQPIKVKNVADHEMHSEQMLFEKSTIKSLAAHDKLIIPVGTTSMRSLESLYWFGVMLSKNPKAEFIVPKLFPYETFKNLPSRQESFSIILEWMEKHGLQEMHGATEIFIFPGYEFKVCDALVTNFHQPGSTLMLLVAAFTNNNWKLIYDEALSKAYRFLSYGDSSILWRN